MTTNEYHFITRWKIKGNVDRIYELLSHPLEFPNWWKKIISANLLEEIGNRKPIRLKLKGWLPYTLQWELFNPQFERPYRITSDSRGDFEGHSAWTLRQVDQHVEALFDWRVSVRKPFLRKWSFVLRPLFIWNHNYIMKTWKKSLEQKLKEL